MNSRTSVRSATVFALLGLAAVALLVSAGFAWKELRGFQKSRKTLAARGVSDQGMESIAVQMRSLDAQRSALTAQTVEAGTALAALEKRIMPMGAGASRLLKLEVLDLAARCGLAIEEIKPLAHAQAARDPEVQAPAGPAPAPGASADAGKIAFLARLPAGEAYRRPLLAMQCSASYGAMRRFFSELDGLTWRVTPVSFGISRSGDGPAAVAGTAGAEEDAPGVSAPVRWAADDGRLRLTVVLAL